MILEKWRYCAIRCQTSGKGMCGCKREVSHLNTSQAISAGPLTTDQTTTSQTMTTGPKLKRGWGEESQSKVVAARDRTFRCAEADFLGKFFPSWSKLPLSWLLNNNQPHSSKSQRPRLSPLPSKLDFLLPVLRSSNLLWWTSWCLSCKHIPLYISNARCDQTTVVKYVLLEMKRWTKRAWLVFARQSLDRRDRDPRRSKTTKQRYKEAMTVKTQLVALTSNDSYKTNSVTKIPSNDLSWYGLRSGTRSILASHLTIRIH